MAEQKQQDNVIMLNGVRAAFLHIFKATQVNGEGKAAFSGSFIMPLDHPDVAILRQAITEVAREKWADKADEILRGLIAADKVCLHNGDTKSQYDGFAGNMFVSSRSPTRPLTIGQDKSPLVEADGKPYSGCYVNAQIAIWAQANNYGKRINAQLRGVQFLRDGDAFGGGAVANVDEFNEVDATADGEAPVTESVSDLW